MTIDDADIEQEIVPQDIDDRFHVRDEKTASWLIRKICEERTHRQRVLDWYETETRRSNQREQFLLQRFGGELSEWTRQELGRQLGRRRSIHLPAGIVGFRTEPMKIVITDETTLAEWCRQHLPGALKITESILKSEVGDHITSTGECPHGAELQGGRDKFYIK